MGNSGPLNQQKERMRQKLERKKSLKTVNKKIPKKKQQILPNGRHLSNGHLALESARNQKVIGDNDGYFVSAPSQSKSKNAEKRNNKRKNNNHHNNKRGNNKRSLQKHRKKQ